MLREQSVGRELIHSCVCLLLLPVLPHLGVLCQGWVPCAVVAIPGVWKLEKTCLMLWTSPHVMPDLPYEVLLDTFVSLRWSEEELGVFIWEDCCCCPPLGNWWYHWSVPHFCKKHVTVSLDADLFCQRSKVYYRGRQHMFFSLCHVDLFKEFILWTLGGAMTNAPQLSLARAKPHSTETLLWFWFRFYF